MEVTDQYVRVPARKPAGDAQIRTKSMDQSKGIWALFDKVSGSIVTYLFRKDKDWDTAKAGAWVKNKATGHDRANVRGRNVGWDGDSSLTATFLASGDVKLYEADGDGKYEGEHLEDVEFAAASLALDSEHVEADEAGVPTAFRILAFGKWDIPKYGGDLIVDEKTGEGTLGYHAWRGMEQLLVDRDHKSKIPTGAGGSTKARGWWTPEVRSDGIWATDLKWTPETYEELKSGGWKYFSPTGGFNKKTKHVDFIDTVALTNDPATLGQMPLTATLTGGTPAEDTTPPPDGATPPTEEVLMATIRELLKLKDDATDEDVETAVKDLQTTAEKVEASEKEVTDLKASMEADKAKDTTEVDTLKAFRASTIEACELKEDAEGKDVLAYVSVLQAKAPEADKAAKLEAKVEELEKFREDSRIEKLVASVSDHVSKENAERIEKLARTLDEELFLSTVQAMPNLKGSGAKPISDDKLADRNQMTDDEVLTAVDRQYIATQAKVDPEGWGKDGEKFKGYVEILREEAGIL